MSAISLPASKAFYLFCIYFSLFYIISEIQLAISYPTHSVAIGNCTSSSIDVWIGCNGIVLHYQLTGPEKSCWELKTKVSTQTASNVDGLLCIDSHTTLWMYSTDDDDVYVLNMQSHELVSDYNIVM